MKSTFMEYFSTNVKPFTILIRIIYKGFFLLSVSYINSARSDENAISS